MSVPDGDACGSRPVPFDRRRISKSQDRGGVPVVFLGALQGFWAQSRCWPGWRMVNHRVLLWCFGFGRPAAYGPPYQMGKSWPPNSALMLPPSVRAARRGSVLKNGRAFATEVNRFCRKERASVKKAPTGFPGTMIPFSLTIFQAISPPCA